MSDAPPARGRLRLAPEHHLATIADPRRRGFLQGFEVAFDLVVQRDLFAEVVADNLF